METQSAIYFDSERAKCLTGKKVAVLGYGSQGSAQAKNLRDSGLAVTIGNLTDAYMSKASQDGFAVKTFSEAVLGADITLMLVPDHAQAEIYQKIESSLKSDSLLVVSHGFSVYFNTLVPRSDLDIGLLAPRMPGLPIRRAYKEGHGVPAFYSVFSDSSGKCLDKVLALADNLGYTKTGIIYSSIEEETEVDLFIEQYMLPKLIALIDDTFEFLVEKGVDPAVAHLEVFSSAELSDLLRIASKEGLYQAWTNHASPTCRFGISEGVKKYRGNVTEWSEMEQTYNGIKDGAFMARLTKEYENGMPNLKKFDDESNQRALTLTQKFINRMFK